MGQSTFQIDCSQMSTILHCATPRSLILIDEFGKGTNISDGTCVYSLILYSSSNTQKKNTTRYRTVHVGVQHSVGIKGSMSENDRRDSFQRSARVQGTRTVPRKRNSSSSHEKYSGTHTFSHLTLISLTTFFHHTGKGSSGPALRPRKVENKDEFKSSKSDYGLWCASKAGVNKHVLDRARYIFDSIDKSQAISALSSQESDDSTKNETSKPSNVAA